jgi:hypothetical protein
VRVSGDTLHPVMSCNKSNRWAVSPRCLLCRCRSFNHLLSRPATVQTATQCRPDGYCEGVGRPITCCYVPKEFKQQRCVAPLDIVRQTGVTKHLSRSPTVQTAGLCRPGCYCEGGGRSITSCHIPQQFKPLGCVASVFTVSVAGVPSPSLTSRNSSNS